MTTIGAVGGSPLPEIPELREATRALEGVFLNQLFQAMRATVPESSLVDSAPGSDVFESMFDEHISEVMAQRKENSLGDLLYDQLRRRIHAMSVDPNR